MGPGPILLEIPQSPVRGCQRVRRGTCQEKGAIGEERCGQQWGVFGTAEGDEGRATTHGAQGWGSLDSAMGVVPPEGREKVLGVGG